MKTTGYIVLTALILAVVSSIGRAYFYERVETTDSKAYYVYGERWSWFPLPFYGHIFFCTQDTMDRVVDRVDDGTKQVHSVTVVDGDSRTHAVLSDREKKKFKKELDAWLEEQKRIKESIGDY